MASEPILGFSATALRKKFGAGMSVASYRDKEVIFSQGDTADALFYIHSGTVKLTVVSTGRKKAIIAFLHRGSFFGEGCLGGQSLRIYTARSIGPSSISRLQKERTVRTLNHDPQFATVFVEYLLSRIIRIEEDLVDQFFNFSERRLARVLVAAWAHNRGLKAGLTAKGEPGNPGGDGWHHPRKGKQLHEWVQKKGLRALQRRPANK